MVVVRVTVLVPSSPGVMVTTFVTTVSDGAPVDVVVDDVVAAIAVALVVVGGPSSLLTDSSLSFWNSC